VAEIKSWLATSREYKAIFQNFHSDVKMISQVYASEGMPGFVMPLGATPATMATYKGYVPGSEDYPFGDKLRRQARVGHGKLRDFTVAWLQRLLGAQNGVAAPSELAEWRAPCYMAKDGHVATKEYPVGDWMSDIGLHDSSKDMVLGLAKMPCHIDSCAWLGPEFCPRTDRGTPKVWVKSARAFSFAHSLASTWALLES
jgi:hypothetical protein